jgi:exonuclease III
MAKFLQLALWNANGLTQLTEELKTFISIHNVDVMLISETHFTEKKLSENFPNIQFTIRTIQMELLQEEPL